MAQPQSADDLDRIGELQQELLFQGVLLRSIDESVVDREAAEEAVQREIKQLRRELKKLQAKAAAGSASSAGTQSSLASAAPPSYAPSESEASMNDRFGLDGAYAGKIYPYPLLRGRQG